MTNILLSKKFIDDKNQLPKTKDLLRKLLSISIPAVIETFFVGLMGILDTMMVGNFSKEALAAVSICQQPVFITLACSFGLNAGIIAIISRRKGENDRSNANSALKQALVIGIIFASIMTICALLFAKPLLIFSEAKSDTIDFAMSYFKIVTYSLIPNYIRLGICAGQRAAGKTKITLITNLIANTLNVILNYYLINGHWIFPKMGVSGAAIATSIGNTVACLIAIGSIFHSKGFLSIRIFDDWRLSKNIVKLIFTISSAAMVEQLFMRAGFFIIAKIVNGLSTDAAAINAIISNVMSLNFNIADGFAIGASTLVGQSLGEKQQKKAFAYGRLSQLTGLVAGFVMLTTVILLKEPITLCFTNDNYIASESARLLAYTSVIILPQNLQWITTGILRGAGDTKYTARNSIFSVAMIRPAFSYLLCRTLGLGIIGSWAGMFLDQMIRCILNNIRFINLKWLHIKV